MRARKIYKKLINRYEKRDELIITGIETSFALDNWIILRMINMN